jgi:hypothetical protein
MLVDRGLIASRFDEVKVLGDGDVPHALKVTAHRFSASAEAKILAAGGAVLEQHQPERSACAKRSLEIRRPVLLVTSLENPKPNWLQIEFGMTGGAAQRLPSGAPGDPRGHPNWLWLWL